MRQSIGDVIQDLYTIVYNRGRECKRSNLPSFQTVALPKIGAVLMEFCTQIHIFHGVTPLDGGKHVPLARHESLLRLN